MYPDLYPSTTLEDVRSKIRSSAENIVGAPVDLEERAFQALEVTTSNGTTPNEVHIWKKLVSLVPALLKLHDELGLTAPINAMHGKHQDLDLTYHDLDRFEWDRPLRKIFMRGVQPTEVANAVAESGIITVRDIIVGLLRSSRQAGKGPSPNDDKTNLVLRRIAKSVGFGESIEWTERLERFSKGATGVVDRLYVTDPSFGSQQFIIYHDGNRARLRRLRSQAHTNSKNSRYLMAASGLPVATLSSLRPDSRIRLLVTSRT